MSTLTWAQNRISKLNDLINDDFKFLWVKPIIKGNVEDLECLKVVETLSKSLENIDHDKFCKDSLKTYLKEFASNNNVPFSDLMKTLRSLLSGLKVIIFYVCIFIVKSNLCLVM